MALLGMLAAGAGVGAARAAEKQFDYDNMLKFEMDRESLRQKFLDRRVIARAAAEAENARIKDWMEQKKYNQAKEDEQAKYDRNRKDSLSDAEVAHRRALEKENIKQGRMDARAAKRALLEKGEGKSTDDENYVTLKDGTKYLPKTNLEKNARTYVKTGKAPNFEAAIDVLAQEKLIANAAKDPMYMQKGIVPVAGEMVRQLYNQPEQQNQSQKIMNYNPKTGKFE